MKKTILALIMAAVLTISLAGCNEHARKGNRGHRGHRGHRGRNCQSKQVVGCKGQARLHGRPMAQKEGIEKGRGQGRRMRMGQGHGQMGQGRGPMMHRGVQK